MAETVLNQQSPPRRRPRKLNRPPTKADVEGNKENERIQRAETPAEVTTDAERPTSSHAKAKPDASRQKRPSSLQQKRRAPRKLLRIIPPQTRRASVEQPEAIDLQDNLSLRVDNLEQHVRSINRRLDNNALEIASLQALSVRPLPGPRSRRTLSSRATSVASAHTDRTARTNGTRRSARQEPQPTVTEPEQDLSFLPPVQRELFRNITTATERISQANATRQQQAQPGTRAVVEELPEEEEDYDWVDDLPTYTSSHTRRAYHITSSSSSSAPTQRNVSLAGSYRIPLPQSLNTADVRALKSGVAAAGTIAREISAAFRGGAGPRQEYVNDAVKETETLDGTERPKSPRSWATLLSDASRIVATAANAIEFEAAVESMPQRGESSSGSGGRGSRGARGPGTTTAATRRRRALPAAAASTFTSGSAFARARPAPPATSGSANTDQATMTTTATPSASTGAGPRPTRRSRQAAKRSASSTSTAASQAETQEEAGASEQQNTPTPAAEPAAAVGSSVANATSEEQAEAE